MLKSTLYKTAKTTVSSTEFKSGEFVGIKWYWKDENETCWWEIVSTEKKSKLNSRIVLPEHHLTQFCL